jgi:signal transduction histidine kinase
VDGADEIERLKQEVEERDDLLAFAAHEMRNPMHTLSLQLASARAAAEAGRITEVVERIGRAQSTLARYVERATVLLELAHLRSGAYPVVVRQVDLVGLLRGIAENARNDAEHHRIALRLDLPGNCTIRTDPSALEHVLGNLLSNAFKHSGASSVVLALLPGEQRVEICIADDGRGIALQDQQRIFHKFDRGSRAQGHGGSGLGLWIALQLAQALGGTLSLDSAPGRGCAFTLSIPTQSPESPCPP